MKRDWRILRVRQWEPTRFWVQSQTHKDTEHLVDAETWECSCPWSNDFRRENEQKTWCAHIRRVRLWLEENKCSNMKTNPPFDWHKDSKDQICTGPLIACAWSFTKYKQYISSAKCSICGRVISGETLKDYKVSTK